MMIKKRGLLFLAVVFAFGLSLSFADAADWNQDFEGISSPPSGWYNISGSMINSGKDSSYQGAYAGAISAIHGSRYAVITPGANNAGPSTTWGGYTNTWKRYSTEIWIYLNANYAVQNAGKCIQWSSTIKTPGGAYNTRDLVFAIKTNNNGFVIAGKTNADCWADDPSKNPVKINQSGWYKFRHYFTDYNGRLYVNMEIFDSNGNLAREGERKAVWSYNLDSINKAGGSQQGQFYKEEINELAVDYSVKDEDISAITPTCLDNDNDNYFSSAGCGGNNIQDCNDNNAGIYEGCASCQDEQIIMRLSSETNAHGELWNLNNYQEEICYNEIFGFSYTGENPHSCTTDNIILKLSADTNAHAELKNGTNYDTDVCYGKLACEKKSSLQECNDFGGEIIASLSADTNAHLSKGNNANYPVKICCKSRAIAQGAYWASMNNEQIENADLNDRVKLMLAGENFGNKEMNFTIYKNVAFWWDTKIAQSSSLAWTSWKANEAGTYHFKAIASDGSSEEIISENLVVSEIEDNSQPVAIILSPEDGDIYFANKEILFAQGSYDEDDFFNYTWNFDGSKIEGNSRSLENYNTSYSYALTGQKNIELEVRDERNSEDRDRAGILVIDLSREEKQVYAGISSPEENEIIFSRTIDFSAVESYAVEISQEAINCIAGNCPSATWNETLISGSPKPFDSLEFNWSFSDRSERNGYGSSYAEFAKTFISPGMHWAGLKLSINPSSESKVNFTLLFNENPYCIIQEDNSFWFSDDGAENSFNDCWKENGLPTESCCLSGYSCNEETGICEFSDIYECADYNAEDECNGYSSGIAINDIETKTGKKCNSGEYTDDNCEEFIDNCRCFWNATEEKCKSRFDVLKICGTGEEIKGECIFNVTEKTDCISGWREVGWNAVWTGKEEDKPEYCNANTDLIECFTEAELGFFSFINFIISAALFIVFYTMAIRKQKNRK